MSNLSFSKDKIKILLLEGIHQNAVDAFKAQGYENVELLPGALEGEELKTKLAEAHMVGIRSRTKLTAEVLETADKLMAIGCFCIGTNQVTWTPPGARAYRFSMPPIPIPAPWQNW